MFPIKNFSITFDNWGILCVNNKASRITKISIKYKSKKRTNVNISDLKLQRTYFQLREIQPQPPPSQYQENEWNFGGGKLGGVQKDDRPGKSSSPGFNISILRSYRYSKDNTLGEIILLMQCHKYTDQSTQSDLLGAFFAFRCT